VIKKKDAMGMWSVLEKGEMCTWFWCGKPEGKRPLGLPKRRWDDDFELNLQEIRMLGVGRLDLAQGEDRWRALVSAMMNRRVL
jgi:hypothetical protein